MHSRAIEKAAPWAWTGYMYTVKLIEVCAHTHWLLFPKSISKHQPLSCWFSLLTLTQWWPGKNLYMLLFPKLSCVVLLPQFQNEYRWKATPFSGPFHIKRFVLVSAVACLRLRQHKPVFESYKLWKESCLSRTKDNQNSREEHFLCIIINTSRKGRGFQWATAQHHLCSMIYWRVFTWEYRTWPRVVYQKTKIEA